MLERVIWLIHFTSRHDSFIHMCDMTHTHMKMYVGMCDMTLYIHMWRHASFSSRQHLYIHMHDPTHTYVKICLGKLFNSTIFMSHSHVWHDSYICNNTPWDARQSHHLGVPLISSTRLMCIRNEMFDKTHMHTTRHTLGRSSIPSSWCPVHTCDKTHTHMKQHMGWPRLVGSLKL